jgi:ABC-type Na+ efflux pump permease subunit
MSKTLRVAVREFVSTVATKGFVIGVLITPLMFLIMVPVIRAMTNRKPPPTVGELAVVDPTDRVFDRVAAYLSEDALQQRWYVSDEMRAALEQVPEDLQAMTQAATSTDAARQAIEQAKGPVPEISVVRLSAGADLDAEKQPLREGSTQDGGRLALVVIAPDAVERDRDKDAFGRYELFVRAKVDDQIIGEIRDAVVDSIIAARVQQAGMDRDHIRALTRVGRVRTKTVTAEGEQETNEIFNTLLPAGFMLLLLISVLTSGQQIMTTTIEEKSSRVVELLLSAVSPMQMMAGKIFGQMCVGLLILVIYAGLGIGTLVTFSLFGLINPMYFVYLVLFYLIAYFMMGSLMAAIGAAVNEIREAQTLMTPVMLVFMLPWLMWFFIADQPNSPAAVTMSFIPPINTFAMLLRITSNTPPPVWQIWLSIGVGIVGVYASLWFAAKVFRVGLLMFGKPPDFRTLVRWVRMA